MYLHIGDGLGILSRDIIGIFDLKTAVFTNAPKHRKKSKSVALVGAKNNSQFLYTTVATSTIQCRAKCFLFDEERI